MHLVSVSHQPSSSMDPRNNPHGYYNQHPPHDNTTINNRNMNTTNGYGVQPQYPGMHPPPQAGYGYPPQQPQWGGYVAPNGYDPVQQHHMQQHPQMQQQHHQEPVAPTPPQEIITPHENDVLMGRGGKNNQHPGNEQLRDMARAMRDRYKASAKKGKSNMSRELVQQVRDLNPKPGRFLKRNPITNDWEDVGDDIAREKVSQVLRDAVSEWTGPKAAAAAAANTDDGEGNEDDEKPNEDDEKPNEDSAPTKEKVEESSIKTDEAVCTPVSVPTPQPLVEEKPISPVPRMVSTASVGMPEVLTSSDASLPKPTVLNEKDEDDFALAMAEADDFLTEMDSSANEQSAAPANTEAKANTPASPAKSPGGGFQRATTRKMSNVPVQAVPWARNKRKAGMFDRYASMNKGFSSSDMSIGSMGSQLSSRNLGTQLSRRQLMSTGARQMSSKQLSSRQLSSRQLSGRNLGRQASGRNMMPADRRQQAFAMMGESDLSLECLSISGMSGHTNKSRSRKNIFMQQYQDMDMGMSDFSLNSLAGPSSHPTTASGGAFNPRPSIIIEGDLEELSAHGSANFDLSDSVHRDLNPALTSSGAAPDEGTPSRKSMAEYADAGIGTSISNMTINTIGTFSGHSRLSRGLFSMGPSMRMDSMHSFLTNGDLQLDMLDDELFDEFAGGGHGENNNDDFMDEADDEFSSDFC